METRLKPIRREPRPEDVLATFNVKAVEHFPKLIKNLLNPLNRIASCIVCVYLLVIKPVAYGTQGSHPIKEKSVRNEIKNIWVSGQ